MRKPIRSQGRGNRGRDRGNRDRGRNRSRGRGRGRKGQDKWKTEDCYQCKYKIDFKALGNNEVLALLDVKTTID
jgi:hypothetical protein